MNEEEIETLCNTGELEVVQPSAAFQNNTKNKCGNMERDGIRYPDIIELLVADEIKRYSWGRNYDSAMLNNFFPGFNDIYFVLSHRRGIRENGNYVERTVGFGMYYSRNNYTIEEIGDYYYVTTNYDLYVHDKILDPRVRYNSEEPHGLLGNDGTRTEEEDAVARRIIERSYSQRSETTRRHRNRYYYATEHQEMRDHVIVNILPRLRTYATDAERSIIKHVPNALTVCSAISKDLEVFDIVEDYSSADSQREYSWLEPSALQNSLRALCTNLSAYEDEDFRSSSNDEASSAARAICNVVEVTTNGSHHKKNEMMVLTIEHGRFPRPWYAQAISTSESPGDLKSVLSRKMLAEHPETDLTRKVLLSKQAEVSSYPDEEAKISLDRLTPNQLTLVRVGEATKSPRGSTLMDICQFGNGVYQAIVDRPMELTRGDSRIRLAPGRYAVCVEDVEAVDFLWYTGLASNDFCNIEIKEIYSRLNLVNESDHQKSMPTNVGDRRLAFSQTSDSTIRSTGRFGRRQISFDNLDEE